MRLFSQIWLTVTGWFTDYRPELHYMRGPGPACAKKFDTPISAK